MKSVDESNGHRPAPSPVEPVELTLESEFRFHCHPGIACFNACCRSIDITLTPYDIVCLKNRLELSSRDFVAQFTIPFEMDPHGMPGLKLSTKPGTTECVFLTAAGCSVYSERPAACRYYALGSMGVRKKGSTAIEDIYFVVKEGHCLGHQEPRTQTVREYRQEQGIEPYDEKNRSWRDLVIKKRSSGPTIGAPSPRSLQLFDMCSYDLDSFADFILSDGFKSVFDLGDRELDELRGDEDKLLDFSMRFLKQVLFGEHTIPIKAGAREERIAKRQAVWARRRAAAREAHRSSSEAQQYE